MWSFLEGFSLHANTWVHALHANTWVHAHDRQGLERLARYAARGAIAEERLSRRDDGKLLYRLRKAVPDGSTELVLTPLELVKRAAVLVPPPKSHLTRFRGVFGPHASLRRALVPQPEHPSDTEQGKPSLGELLPALLLPTLPALPPPTAPRVPWAELLKRSFGFDVLQCPCGGRLRVVAFIEDPNIAQKVLERLGLTHAPLRIAPARGPPQLSLLD
jgi:hypothetical protein